MKQREKERASERWNRSMCKNEYRNERAQRTTLFKRLNTQCWCRTWNLIKQYNKNWALDDRTVHAALKSILKHIHEIFFLRSQWFPCVQNNKQKEREKEKRRINQKRYTVDHNSYSYHYTRVSLSCFYTTRQAKASIQTSMHTQTLCATVSVYRFTMCGSSLCDSPVYTHFFFSCTLNIQTSKQSLVFNSEEKKLDC